MANCGVLLLLPVLAWCLPSYLVYPATSSTSAYFSTPSALYVSDSNSSSLPGTDYAILFSLQTCVSCYHNEPQLVRILRLLADAGLPTYRCELSRNPKLQRKYKVVRFPYLVAFVNGREVKYRGLMTYKGVSLWLRILKEPVGLLQEEWTSEELANFLFVKEHRPQSLVLMATVNLTKGELEVMQGIALSGLNSQTQFVVFTHPRTIRNLRRLYPDWFIVDEYKALAYIRYTKNSEFHFPLVAETLLELSKVVKKAMLVGVQEFTDEHYNLAENQKPILVAVVDSAFEIYKSRKLLDMLEGVLQDYEDEIYVFWVEGCVNPQKKRILNIPENEPPPSLGFFDVYYNHTSRRAFAGKFEKYEIEKYIENYININYTKKTFSQLAEALALTSTFKLLRPEQFESSLPNPIPLSKMLGVIPLGSPCIIFCLAEDGLTPELVPALQLISDRLHRLLYNSLGLVITEGSFFFVDQHYSPGVYFTTLLKDQTRITEMMPADGITCERVLGWVAEWVDLPDHPCVKETSMRQYLQGRAP